MKIPSHIVLILLLLTFLPASLSAQEIRYVTDRLSLGLFEKEKASGKRITTLDSGTKLEVLSETRSFAKVRTADGDVGWVKSAYLIREKPAGVKVSELETLYEKKELELEECLAAEPEPPEHTIQRLKTLENQLDYKEKKLSNAKIRIEKLVQRINVPKDGERAYEYLLGVNPLLWYAVAGIVLFIAGTLWGVHIFNSRLRRRFYGFTLS